MRLANDPSPPQPDSTSGLMPAACFRPVSRSAKPPPGDHSRRSRGHSQPRSSRVGRQIQSEIHSISLPRASVQNDRSSDESRRTSSRVATPCRGVRYRRRCRVVAQSWSRRGLCRMPSEPSGSGRRRAGQRDRQVHGSAPRLRLEHIAGVGSRGDRGLPTRSSDACKRDAGRPDQQLMHGVRATGRLRSDG